MNKKITTIEPLPKLVQEWLERSITDPKANQKAFARLHKETFGNRNPLSQDGMRCSEFPNN